MKSPHVAFFALIPLLAFAPSCGDGDTTTAGTSTDTTTGTETGTSTDTETGTSTGTGTETGTSTGTGTETGTSTGTGTETSTDVPCTDDAECMDLGMVCNESAGICVASTCEGKDDFTQCKVVTTPDRSYDICVNEACVSPGCGDESCNVPGPHFPLPDTGQRKCYDATMPITCPSPGQPFYGQDAQIGWDTTHPASDRFTRSLIVIDQPVVTDNVTALVWQGCALGLSGDDCATGVVTKAPWADQLASCDSLVWGGHDDWRLPDPYELQSLVDHETDSAPFIDAAMFPATPTEWTWTSSSEVGSDWAWTVLFAFGTVAIEYKPNNRVARCVRGGAMKPRHFEAAILAGDRIVTDSLNGLMWQGCPDGTSGDDCGTGLITWHTWETALAYCEGLSWAGFDDWRLPDIIELLSIVDYRYTSTSLDPAFFPGLSNVGWTSSTRAEYPSGAWIVNFEYGSTTGPDKTKPSASARCARNQ